ncbi:Uma2 family endonuclease [Myxococcota bacterium]|nr:Uma2 family endonuclease [Myxococcota bacterium]
MSSAEEPQRRTRASPRGLFGRSWERDPEDEKKIIDPRVIIEVLSPRTAEYDRGEKFENDACIDTLAEYVLVAHDRRELEVRTRTAAGWETKRYGEGERATLTAISVAIDVTRLYEEAAEPTCGRPRRLGRLLRGHATGTRRKGRSVR